MDASMAAVRLDDTVVSGVLLFLAGSLVATLRGPVLGDVNRAQPLWWAAREVACVQAGSVRRYRTDPEDYRLATLCICDRAGWYWNPSPCLETWPMPGQAKW
jgi:hypothetical protein